MNNDQDLSKAEASASSESEGLLKTPEIESAEGNYRYPACSDCGSQQGHKEDCAHRPVCDLGPMLAALEQTIDHLYRTEHKNCADTLRCDHRDFAHHGYFTSGWAGYQLKDLREFLLNGGTQATNTGDSPAPPSPIETTVPSQPLADSSSDLVSGGSTEAETELLPCPFCRAAGAFISWDGNRDRPDDWSVNCNNTLVCGAGIRGMLREADAATAWNARATTDEAKLREAIEQSILALDLDQRELHELKNVVSKGEAEMNRGALCNAVISRLREGARSV